MLTAISFADCRGRGSSVLQGLQQRIRSESAADPQLIRSFSSLLPHCYRSCPALLPQLSRTRLRCVLLHSQHSTQAPHNHTHHTKTSHTRASERTHTRGHAHTHAFTHTYTPQAQPHDGGEQRWRRRRRHMHRPCTASCEGAEKEEGGQQIKRKLAPGSNWAHGTTRRAVAHTHTHTRTPHTHTWFEETTHTLRAPHTTRTRARRALASRSRSFGRQPEATTRTRGSPRRSPLSLEPGSPELPSTTHAVEKKIERTAIPQ